MFQIDGVHFAPFAGVDGRIATIVKNHAVLQNLADGCSFMLLCGLQKCHRVDAIVGHCTTKELSARTKTEFGGAEGVFDGAIRARL